jgi:hypothetical protein
VPYEDQHEWRVITAVVTDDERPSLDAFEACLAAAQTSEAEHQAVQLYMALMQRCWDRDPIQRPRFKQACSSCCPGSQGVWMQV